MVTATLYIEGGGEGKDLRTRFRQGWRTFFDKEGVDARTKIVRGGGRQQTFNRFVAAVRDRRPDTLPLLLVDSEGPVQFGHSPWQHLQARDRWQKPDEANDNQAFLMVQFMETWFLADKDGLRGYFGHGFKEGAIRQWPKLEAVPKKTVLEALESATVACGKRYEKGRTSFDLLAYIDPARVKAACPHADALLERLAALPVQ